MGCDWCDDTRWRLLDHESGVGFVYAPCPKCSWLPRTLPPILAPVDALAFISDSKRITLGEEEAWRQHAEENSLVTCFGIQEPPNNPMIYNRRQVDGAFRSLAGFWKREPEDQQT